MLYSRQKFCRITSLPPHKATSRQRPLSSDSPFWRGSTVVGKYLPWKRKLSLRHCTPFVSHTTMQQHINRPFPSSPGPLFQNEGRCSAFDMEIIFHSHPNKTHFHKKGCAPSLILKARVFGIRKWPVAIPHQYKCKELSFPLFSALLDVHPKYDALHGSLVSFDCLPPKHNRIYILKIST